ncbi:MAG: sulfotransferase [Planktomarina sp.]
MHDRRLLICPGATKAGTSWLYRWLSGHSDCHLKAVKELHYFSSDTPDEIQKRVDVLSRQVANFEGQLLEAQAASQDWKVRNMMRRITDTNGLIATLQSDRSDLAPYTDYVGQGAEAAQVVGDITPAYATLDTDKLSKILETKMDVRVLFLVRDPLDRLWSHVRMHAKRYLREGQTVVEKSARVLDRIMNKDHESHITDRGDYVGIIGRLQAAFGDKLHVAYAENLSTEVGQKDICRFLGIAHEAPDQTDRAHTGLDIPFPEKRRRATVKFLKDQYDFVAANFGPVPSNWAMNRGLLA